MSTYNLHTVFRNWHIRRFLGLGIALFMLSQTILLKDGLLAIFTAVMFVQVIGNIGCFGSKGCAVDVSSSKESNSEKEITFTEV